VKGRGQHRNWGEGKRGSGARKKKKKNQPTINAPRALSSVIENKPSVKKRENETQKKPAKKTPKEQNYPINAQFEGEKKGKSNHLARSRKNSLENQSTGKTRKIPHDANIKKKEKPKIEMMGGSVLSGLVLMEKEKKKITEGGALHKNKRVVRIEKESVACYEVKKGKTRVKAAFSLKLALGKKGGGRESARGKERKDRKREKKKTERVQTQSENT